MNRFFPYLRSFGSSSYACISWTALIIVLHCLPGSALPQTGIFEFKFFDKLVHFGMFGSFVLFWTIYFMHHFTDRLILIRVLFGMVLIGVVFGVLLESIQYAFIPKRAFEEADMLTDFAGALVAAIWLWHYGRKKELFPPPNIEERPL